MRSLHGFGHALQDESACHGLVDMAGMCCVHALFHSSILLNFVSTKDLQ